MAFWHMLVRLYLLIPDFSWETHVFHTIHRVIPWYVPGMIAFGIAPASVLLIWMGDQMFGKFRWFKASRYYRFVEIELWKVSYYLVWAVYIFWLPLPWPRIAFLIWAVYLYRRYRFFKWRYRTRHIRRRMWQAIMEGRLEDI
ncbi:hypothetical protein [Alicyclobacillus tolerans]|uniref:Uncharacterized protein n=1 Tax=Alicyclobacillus tolerans TaxID=90970 RepID=A0A1M6UBI2_9BACL|nr:hypothetical protein [Alicyclobacillus montanus]SHK66536.1 hypothetical protein SAMN05443507_11930 [Alicyclobacillus montanus]